MNFSTILWALFLAYAGYLILSGVAQWFKSTQQLKLIAANQKQGIEWFKAFLQYAPLAKQLGHHVQLGELDAQAKPKVVSLKLTIGLVLTTVLYGVGIATQSYTCIILTILLAMIIRYFFKLTVIMANLPISTLINNSPNVENLHNYGHLAITLQLGNIVRIKEQLQKTSSIEEHNKLVAELLFEPFAFIQALESKKTADLSEETSKQLHNLQFCTALITQLIKDNISPSQLPDNYPRLSDRANQIIADLATMPK